MFCCGRVKLEPSWSEQHGEASTAHDGQLQLRHLRFIGQPEVGESARRDAGRRRESDDPEER